MKLVCYAVDRDPFPLRPAPVTREWMDRIPDHHAYRCLPLNIANSHGWEIASPCGFEVEWDGDPNVRGIAIRALDGYPDVSTVAVSHFAHGIVSFYLSYLFRTEPEWNLLATGPFNRPKDGIAPLTGVIETNWLPYPFTMNWQMTRRGKVRFEKDEPLCVVFPVRVRAVLDTHPEIRNLADEPSLEAQALAWQKHRDEFAERVYARDPAALKEAWQRYYFLGKLPDGTNVGGDAHMSKLRLAEPLDRRGIVADQK
jgi:hypothetical protein